jgi:hypothetical protein
MASTDQTTGLTTHRSAWVSFAAYMLLIGAFFQIIAGLVALVQPELFVATSNQLFVFSYDQWGWISLFWGVIMITAGISLLAGKMWGRIIAVALAIVSALINFAFIWAYPLWSVLIIIVDIMVIFSVVMHNSKELTD